MTGPSDQTKLQAPPAIGPQVRNHWSKTLIQQDFCIQRAKIQNFYLKEAISNFN